MGIGASVLLDPVEFLLALLLLPVELTTILKGRGFINGAECPGLVRLHQIGIRVLAVLVLPSTSVPETVPLVVLCKCRTLVIHQVLMEGLALTTAKALEAISVRASSPEERGGLLIALGRTCWIAVTAVRTLLDLVDLLSSRSSGALGSRMQTLNGLFIQRTDIRTLLMIFQKIFFVVIGDIHLCWFVNSVEKVGRKCINNSGKFQIIRSSQLKVLKHQLPQDP